MRGSPTLPALQLQAFDRAGSRLWYEQLERVQEAEDAQDPDQTRRLRRPTALESLHGGEADARLVPELSLGEVAFQPCPCQPPPELGEHSIVREL